MDNLPIPNRLRSNWVAALILTTIVFLIYYLFAYDLLFNLYREQFDKADFQESKNQIKVWAYTPKYFNTSEPTWAYILVENKGGDPIYDIEVYLITTFDDTTLLLNNLYGKEVYSSGAKFDVIAPHSVTTARVSLIAQKEPEITKVLIIKSREGTREELDTLTPKEYIKVNESSLRSLQHNFLENILLPPWSNGFILALVLFTTYLARKDEIEEPRLFLPEWWNQVIETVNKSGKIVLGIGLLTVLFLIIKESTASAFFSITALVIMGILENDLLSEYISKRFGIRQVLIFWAFTLGVLGSLLIFMIPFFSILEFLFPSIGFSRLPPIEGWLWQFIAIVVVLIWLFHIKNPEKLAAYIRPLDRWRYRFLSLSFIPITILFYEKYPIEGYLAWKSLLIECIPWILLSFVSSVMPIGLKQLAQQLQNNIESSPLPVKKSKQKKTTTP